jgi:hypothetical protein
MRPKKTGVQIGVLSVALIAANAALADSPSVAAVLSNFQATVGEAVQLQIRVTGAANAKVPQDISVDGLEIHPTGTSQQYEMRNFSVSSSVIYNYTILPLRTGRFKIPSQEIRIGSSSLRTPELTLNVVDSSSGSAGTTPKSQSSTTNKIAFAELIVAKKEAYVGEMIPAEIRLGFDSRVHAKLEDGPDLSGQGFTTQKLQQPRENLDTIGGKTYQVLTFKTAIAAARTGRFEIGPVQAKAVAVLPRRPSAPRNRPRSPFDLFDMDDPFSDPFFSDPFGNFGEHTEIPLKSEPVTLEVKPLPPNPPPSFSGAVGNFTMTVDAKPKSLQVGDPITLTAAVSGRGNFDRMTAPTLEGERGWHQYPPSSKFTQDDDVGISGTKTFESVLSPNEKKQAIPGLVFAYFDPIKEGYVTLRSNSVPIEVQGGGAPAPASAAATSSPVSTTPAAAGPTPASKPQDILYQLNDFGRPRSFTPLYERPVYWIVQSGPLVLLLGFVGWKIRRAKAGDREARRIAARHQEMAKLVRELRRGHVSPQVYFSQAARVVQLKTSLACDVNPNLVDAETAAATFKVDENSRARLRQLFERSDELRYSGTHNGAETISPENQREVLNLVESLHA